MRLGAMEAQELAVGSHGEMGHRGGIGGEIWGQRGEGGVGKLNLGQNGGKPRQRGGILGVD